MSLSGIWNRYGCCPKNEENDILPDPNTLIIQLQGTVYRAIPNFFDGNGIKMVPIQFETNHFHGYYYFKFFQPQKIRSILMTTSDDVLTNILVNEKVVDMQRFQKHNGYVSWLLEGEF